MQKTKVVNQIALWNDDFSILRNKEVNLGFHTPVSPHPHSHISSPGIRASKLASCTLNIWPEAISTFLKKHLLFFCFLSFLLQWPHLDQVGLSKKFLKGSKTELNKSPVGLEWSAFLVGCVTTATGLISSGKTTKNKGKDYKTTVWPVNNEPQPESLSLRFSTT